MLRHTFTETTKKFKIKNLKTMKINNKYSIDRPSEIKKLKKLFKNFNMSRKINAAIIGTGIGLKHLESIEGYKKFISKNNL